MGIVETVSLSDFKREFEVHGRQDNFSDEGLTAIYDHLNEISDDTGENIELDVIEICCEFSEISLEEIENETGCTDLDDLKEHTWICKLDNDRVVYAAFSSE